MDVIEFIVPVKTISENNRSRHEHWATTRKRAKEQREAAYYAARTAMVSLMQARQRPRAAIHEHGATITMKRIAPRTLDTDNLAGALKHVRDGIADALGINDANPRFIWLCEQQRDGKSMAVAVKIETLEARP